MQHWFSVLRNVKRPHLFKSLDTMGVESGESQGRSRNEIFWIHSKGDTTQVLVLLFFLKKEVKVRSLLYYNYKGKHKVEDLTQHS